MADIVQNLGFNAKQAISELNQLNATLLAVEGSLRKFAEASKAASTAGFERGMTQAQSAAKKTSTALSATSTAAGKTGRALQTAGKQGAAAGKSVTLSWETVKRVIATQIIVRALTGTVQAFAQATESAKEFGLAVAEIQTLARGAVGSTEQLNMQILETASSLGKTGKEFAEGVYQTLSNQVVEAGQAMEFMTTATQLAKITAAETADAVNALSSVMNSYGLSADKAEHVSDVLFKTVELGRLRLSEIGNTLGRVTPLTAALGISFEETAAAIATMTRQGVRADTSITQLRAVTQKLIKPTEKMLALFRRWGVRDGKQAIETFGGLFGVLKKLAAETDNNDAEMASYFNRVRAIVGVMGTMTDQGREMEKSLKGIANAAGAAKKAWDEFAKSDAEQLVKAQTRLQNALTETGSSFIGLKTVANNSLAAIVEGFTVYTDGIDESTRTFLRQLNKIDKEAAEAAKKAMEEVKTVTNEELGEILQVEREMLAEFNAKWNEAMDEAEADTKSMAAGVKAALKQSTSGLDAVIKPLEKFVEKYEDGQKDLQLGIDEAKADKAEAQFRKGFGNLTKFQQIDKITSKATQQSARALELWGSKVDGVSQKQADAAQKRALAWADEAVNAAKATKNTVKIREAEKAREKIIGNTLKGLERQQKLQQDIIGPARDALNKFKTEQAERKKVIDGVAKSFEKLAEAKDLTEREGIRDNIFQQLEKLTEKGFEGSDATLRKALNIQGLPDDLAQELKTQQYEIVLNAEKSIAEIQAKLDEFDKKQAAKFDPTGEKVAQASFVLDRQKAPRESSAAFVAEGLERAQKIADTYQTSLKELEGQEAALAVKSQNLTGVTNALNDAMKGQLDSVDAFNILTAKGLGGDDAVQDYLAKRFETLKQTNPEMNGYIQSLRDANTQLQNGKPLDDEQVQNLRDKAQAFRDSSSATKNNTTLLAGAETALQNYNAELKKIDAEKELLNKPAAQDAVKLIGLMADETEKSKDAMERLRDASGGVATNAKAFATAASDALGNTGGLVQAWNSIKAAVVDAANAAVDAIRKIAAAKQAAATASFHGGYQKLAAGGTAQGQDTIPAILSPGEFVVNSASTKKFFSELNAINSGSQPVRREQGGSVTNVGDINVTVQGGDSSQQTVREIGGALRRDIRRGLIKLS